jgi:hypothetical protein
MNNDRFGDSTGTFDWTPTGTGIKIKDGGLSFGSNTSAPATPVAGAILGATITAPAISSPVITGKPTIYSTVTTYTGATDAIDFSLGDIFFLSRAAAADAATLAAPVAADNGRVITIVSGTAFAHTITVSGGLGGAGAADDVITFTNRVAASVTLKAIAAQWYMVGSYLAAVA